jgi:hypothetical protein
MYSMERRKFLMSETVRRSEDGIEPSMGHALVSRRIDGTDPPRFKLVHVVPDAGRIIEKDVVVQNEPLLPMV